MSSEGFTGIKDQVQKSAFIFKKKIKNTILIQDNAEDRTISVDVVYVKDDQAYFRNLPLQLSVYTKQTSQKQIAKDPEQAIKSIITLHNKGFIFENKEPLSLSPEAWKSIQEN